MKGMMVLTPFAGSKAVLPACRKERNGLHEEKVGGIGCN